MSDVWAHRVRRHLEVLYPEREDLDELIERCATAIGVREPRRDPGPRIDPYTLWSERDSVLITYADTFTDGDERPLRTLGRFVAKHGSAFSTVHVLPFAPSSSDRGFAVIDHRAVRSELGDWDDIAALGLDADLMFDLVCNHVSASSAWFRQFVAGEPPGRNYFVTASPADDLSAVVRSRTHPLLHEVDAAAGPRWVWCTFSADQVDLDWRNPEVLLEMLRVLDDYIDRGARLIRLDAVAFVWKEIGTPCIHLPQTHELVRLLRTLLHRRAPTTVLVTETNVPNVENLTYFGNGNEAHLIYNFALPPLLVHGLQQGRSDRLTAWMMSMPPAPEGCAYLNFIGAHDGIGLRPAEGLLSDEEIDDMVAAVHALGGLHSTYLRHGGERPYELNIAPIDAFGNDDLTIERFLCAHTVMLGLEGIPAMWVHSLLGTPSDRSAAMASGVNRDINRSQVALADVSGSPVMKRLSDLVHLRGQQAAFHPNATQYTLHLGDALFGFWRQSRDRSQSIFAVHNLTDAPQDLHADTLNLTLTESWTDLLSGRRLAHGGEPFALAPYQSAWITNRR